MLRKSFTKFKSQITVYSGMFDLNKSMPIKLVLYCIMSVIVNNTNQNMFICNIFMTDAWRNSANIWNN